MDHDYKGNIGELQNVIKATCANVLLHEDEEQLCIHLLDLPDALILAKNSLQMKYYNQEQEETMIPVRNLNWRPSRTPAERRNRTIRSSPAVNSMYRTSSICCSSTRNTVSSVPTNHIC